MGILNENEPKKSQEFLDAFHYAQAGTGRRLQLGRLAFLYRDKKYYESIKVAHAFADYYVDKALEYRRQKLASHKTATLGDHDNDDDDTPGKRVVVLLQDMALETDNRDDLRNQIMHGMYLVLTLIYTILSSLNSPECHACL